MSIATKTGDAGMTGLMFNRRVSKCDPRVEAYGTVDELNAALGLARALATRERIREELLAVQQDLVTLMGELATAPQDWGLYVGEGHQLVSGEMTARVDRIIADIESQNISFKGWAMPGACPASAALEVARATCRRAERRVCALGEAGQLRDAETLVYLNRLSDALWLLARWTESESQAGDGGCAT